MDSEPPAFRRFQESLRMVGVEASLDELLGYVGKTTRQIADAILQKYKPEVKTEDFLKLHQSRGSFYAVSDEVKPMEGLVDFLEEQKSRRMKLAVVSSTSSVSVVTALNRMKLLKYFDAVVCGDMVKEGKPSPEGYLKALAFLGCKPEEALVIEDSPTGISAGKSAGAYVIGYKGSEHKQDTSGADWEVSHYRELMGEAFRGITLQSHSQIYNVWRKKV